MSTNLSKSQKPKSKLGLILKIITTVLSAIAGALGLSSNSR